MALPGLGLMEQAFAPKAGGNSCGTCRSSRCSTYPPCSSAGTSPSTCSGSFSTSPTTPARSPPRRRGVCTRNPAARGSEGRPRGLPGVLHQRRAGRATRRAAARHPCRRVRGRGLPRRADACQRPGSRAERYGRGGGMLRPLDARGASGRHRREALMLRGWQTHDLGFALRNDADGNSRHAVWRCRYRPGSTRSGVISRLRTVRRSAWSGRALFVRCV